MAFSILRFLGLKKPPAEPGKPASDQRIFESDADPLGGDNDDGLGDNPDGNGGDGE